MSKEIAKSPEVLQKEAEIAALGKALKKKKTTLKSLKTRLNNTRERITEVQRGSQVQMMNGMEDLDNLRIEIAKLAAELKNVKGMTAKEKAELSAMAESMANEGFGEDFEEFKAKKERMESGDFDFDEEFGERIRDMFEPFKVQPDEAEKKNIRKVFLNLSKKFHPDKAKDTTQAEEYHSVMQKINEAYQNNDIETLLEMERLYIREEPDFEGVAMADILQQKIDYLNREIAFITNQVERTSAEIKGLRESDMGQMLTNLDRADREGEGIDTMIEHLNKSVEVFTKLRDALKDSIKKGKVSPKIHELLNELGELGMEDEFGLMDHDMPDSMEEIMEQIGDMLGVDMSEIMGEIGDNREGGGDLFNIFGADNYTPNPNPKFAIGSSVCVIKSIKSPIMEKVNMKGWEGRVSSAHIDNRNKNAYNVVFDSITLNEMTKKYLERAIDEIEDFQEHTFIEYQLKAVEPRDTPKDAVATYRTKYHNYNWKYMGEQGAKFKEILLTYPDRSDVENWADYVNQKLRFPFDVVTMGNLRNPPGLKAKLMEISHLDDNFGVMVKLKIPHIGVEAYPLMDLDCAKKKDKRQKTLDLYHQWADESLDLIPS